MYLIPGCYMGNVMPTAAMLRPGCDISKLTTISHCALSSGVSIFETPRASPHN